MALLPTCSHYSILSVVLVVPFSALLLWHRRRRLFGWFVQLSRRHHVKYIKGGSPPPSSSTAVPADSSSWKLNSGSLVSLRVRVVTVRAIRKSFPLPGCHSHPMILWFFLSMGGSTASPFFVQNLRIAQMSCLRFLSF